MSEKFKNPRFAGSFALAASLLITSAGCSVSSREHGKDHSSSSAPIKLGKSLAVGAKLNEIPIITPTPGDSHDYTFRDRGPNTPSTGQDLVAIYSPLLSSIISEASNTTSPNTSAAFLVTSAGRTLFLSVVEFNTNTKIVSGFGSGVEVSSLQPVMTFSGHSDSDVTIEVGPTPDHKGATIEFNGVIGTQITVPTIQQV